MTCIAKILTAKGELIKFHMIKVELTKFHMPKALYAKIPIDKIQESPCADHLTVKIDPRGPSRVPPGPQWIRGDPKCHFVTPEAYLTTFVSEIF